MPINLIPLSPCWHIVEHFIEMRSCYKLEVERILGPKSFERRCPFGEDFRDRLLEMAALKPFTQKENQAIAKKLELGWGIKLGGQQNK